MVGLDRISAAQRRMRKAEPSLCCSISPLDKDGLGLLSAKQAKLDGTSGSGCPCAERGSDGSRDGAEQGHLRVLDLSLLWGFCGIPEDEVQFLTWLQVTVNMLQLLLLTALDFCIVQAFFYAFGFCTYRTEFTPLPCALELLGGLFQITLLERASKAPGERRRRTRCFTWYCLHLLRSQSCGSLRNTHSG